MSRNLPEQIGTGLIRHLMLRRPRAPGMQRVPRRHLASGSELSRHVVAEPLQNNVPERIIPLNHKGFAKRDPNLIQQ